MVANANGPRFPLGTVVGTPGAMDAIKAANTGAATLLTRHMGGDWGDVPPEDARANERALENRARILSAYTLSTGVKVWVLTEADRSSTCILLPEEY
jgi:hypothetical protein